MLSEVLQFKADQLHIYSTGACFIKIFTAQLDEVLALDSGRDLDELRELLPFLFKSLHRPRFTAEMTRGRPCPEGGAAARSEAPRTGSCAPEQSPDPPAPTRGRFSTTRRTILFSHPPGMLSTRCSIIRFRSAAATPVASIARRSITSRVGTLWKPDKPAFVEIVLDEALLLGFVSLQMLVLVYSSDPA